MAFVVQNDAGTAENANAYVTVEELRAYWEDRGVFLTTWGDIECQAAIVKASQYIDIRFTYMGLRTEGDDQPTEWPRTVATTIPNGVKWACCEYAYHSANVPLTVQAQSSDRLIVKERKKLSVMETEIEYAGGKSSQRFNVYTVADSLLQRTGFVSNSGGCIRA